MTPTQQALEALRKSLPIVQACANANPCWTNGIGTTQDPYGAHALVGTIGAAIASLEAAPAAPDSDSVSFDVARMRRVAVDVLTPFAGEVVLQCCDEIDRLSAAPAAVAEPAEPMLAWLCERHSYVLRVGQPYVFQPAEGCESCAAMAEQAREAYGPTMGAPSATTPPPAEPSALDDERVAACVVLLHRMLEAPTIQVSVGWKNAIGPALLALKVVFRPTEPSAEVVMPEPDEHMQGREISGGMYQCGYTTDQMRAYGDARASAAILADRARGVRVPLTDEQIDGLNGMDTASRVRFYEHDFYVLSNFSAFNLRWKGNTFPTSEHAYHWEKFAGYWDATNAAGNIAVQVLNAPSAHEAFKIAEGCKVRRRPNWDDMKVGIMLDILRAKARQHEYVRRKLLATGDRELVEDSWRDDFWGWGPNRDGKNMLGRLWMQVRSELRGITPTTPNGAKQ